MTAGRAMILTATLVLSMFCVWSTPLLFLKELILVRAGVKTQATRTRFVARFSFFTLYSLFGIAALTIAMQFVVAIWALATGTGGKFIALVICISLVIRVLLVVLHIGCRISVSRQGIGLYISAFVEEGVTLYDRVGRALEGLTTLYVFYLFVVLLQSR